MALPVAIYSSSQVRAIDADATERLGIPGYTLMKRAGEGALRCLRSRFPRAYRLLVVCGGGNNGGDGYVLARFAQAAGLTVTVLAVTVRADLKGDARRAHDDFLESGGSVLPFSAAALEDGELIVDALLGTGARGVLRPEFKHAIVAMNRSGKPIFALDLPSGLDAETGLALGEAIRAEATITFVGLKTGLFLGDGPQYTGALDFDDLELLPPQEPRFVPPLLRITDAEIRVALPRRARAAHKGSFGRVLVVGGGSGMPGAARLAAEAALRVGAGLVTVATAPENLVAMVARRPELICRGIGQAAELEEWLHEADVIAVGPGLGRSAWARELIAYVLKSAKPLVVDADALNVLAEWPRHHERWILTPHPGEAARLLGAGPEVVQRDRLAALATLAERYGGVVVLKGAGTLVGRAAHPAGFCERGNPGMATAGMGDVLAGVIAGILAQCRDLEQAARVGVLIHALAGDAAARAGERGLLASDVIKELRTWVNLV